MKTLPTRRRGAAVRRALRVAAVAAAAAAGSQSALAQQGADPHRPTPEPPLPTRLAKSQPQRAVGGVIDKSRSDWVRRQAVLPGGKVLDNYEYDFRPTTAQERFRNLRGLEKINDYEVQRALAQLSGELYASLPIARARIEDQTYRNLANLLRPDGVFAGAGVAPVVAVPAAAPCPPTAGGIVFDGPAPVAAGGLYGPGFAPGVASGGISVAPPAPVPYAQNYGGSVYGQSFAPTPDPTFHGGGTINGTVVTPGGPPAAPAAPAGTPVPHGSYLTPDGRLVDGAGNPVDVGGRAGDDRPDGDSAAPRVQRAPAPLGPTGRPLNGTPDPSFDGLNGPGLNAPTNGGANGGGEPIPPGSTFGPDGAVLGPTGAVLRPANAGIQTASHSTPAHGPAYGHGGAVGPLYGGPVYAGPGYGHGDCTTGQCGPAPIAPVTPVYPAPAPVAVAAGPAVAPVGGLWGGWVSGYYLDGDLRGTAHRAGVDYNGGGINVGLTRQVSETLLVGAFFGYAGLEGRANRYDLGEYDVDTWQFGAYTRKLLGNFYVIGAATFGIDDYSTHRDVDYNFIQRPATANFQGNTASVFGELGYTHAVTCSHFIQPFASLQYAYVHRGAFHEEGTFGKKRHGLYYDPSHPDGYSHKAFADGEDDFGSNLTVGDTRDDFLRFRVGGRYFRRLRNCAGTFRVLPEVRAFYAHERYDPSTFKVRMNDLHDCPFAVAGLHDVNDAFVLGTGLTFAHCKGVSLFGNVDGFFADRDEAIALTAGGQYVW